MDGADSIKYILENNIEGAIVECGVDSGTFEHLWINELMNQNAVRDIYLYDTFAGLVEPGEYDYTCDNATIYKMDKDEVYYIWQNLRVTDKINGWCYTPLEHVKERLNSTGYPQDKLHYIVGDVMETLKENQIFLKK